MLNFATHELMLAHLARHDNDNDVRQIARALDEHLGERACGLFVGCVDEPLACVSALTGHETVGIDLRPYNGGMWTVPEYEGAPYSHQIADLLTTDIGRDGTFDFVVAVSAIEHFGLSEFGGVQDPMGDVWAMRRIYELLRPGGLAFITLPEGATWHCCPNWRRYTQQDLTDRIIGPFSVVAHEHWWTSIEGNLRASPDDVATYDRSADISALLVLSKP